MRLIDADEVLKRWGLKFYAMGGDRLGPNGDEISFYVNGLLNEIQNAPTVDTTCPNCDSGYAQGYSDGYLKGKEERPQCEWITRHKLNSFGQDVVCFECNKCGEYKVPLYHLLITEPLKVCPNCGADMRGGRE